MDFVIIGIFFMAFGVLSKSNPENLRRFLNSNTEPAQNEISRTRTAGTIVLVCGALLIIIGIIKLIAG